MVRICIGKMALLKGLATTFEVKACFVWVIIGVLAYSRI